MKEVNNLPSRFQSYDKTRSTGEENGKSLQYSCLKKPMNSMKRQKGKTPEDERFMLVGVQYATGQYEETGLKQTLSCGCVWW